MRPPREALRIGLVVLRWAFRLGVAGIVLYAGIECLRVQFDMDWLTAACIKAGEVPARNTSPWWAYGLTVGPWAVMLAAQAGTIHRGWSWWLLPLDVLRIVAALLALGAIMASQRFIFPHEPLGKYSCFWEIWQDFADELLLMQLVAACPLALLTVLAVVPAFFTRRKRA